jgi:hypothetical protein
LKNLNEIFRQEPIQASPSEKVFKIDVGKFKVKGARRRQPQYDRVSRQSQFTQQSSTKKLNPIEEVQSHSPAL